MHHSLKVLSEFYEDLEKEVKTFEVRKGRFQIGDTLDLIEIEKNQTGYIETGRKLKVKVTYILRGGRFGISNKCSVLGIKLV